jgi:hypothetical protein
MRGLGVRRDNTQACAWFLLAIHLATTVFRNPEVDEVDLIRTEFEALAKGMTPAEISAAEQWVAQWIQTHPPTRDTTSASGRPTRPW